MSTKTKHYKLRTGWIHSRGVVLDCIRLYTDVNIICTNSIGACMTKHLHFSDLPFSNTRQLLDLRHDLRYLKLQPLRKKKWNMSQLVSFFKLSPVRRFYCMKRTGRALHTSLFVSKLGMQKCSVGQFALLTACKQSYSAAVDRQKQFRKQEYTVLLNIFEISPSFTLKWFAINSVHDIYQKKQYYRHSYNALLPNGGFSYCTYCVLYAHRPKHPPQYHRAAPSSCVGCLTAHPSPPGTDPQELKHTTEKKAQQTLASICTRLTSLCPLSSLRMRENRSELQIKSSTYKLLRSSHQRWKNWKRFILLGQLSDRLLLHWLLQLVQLEQHISRACMFVLIN